MGRLQNHPNMAADQLHTSFFLNKQRTDKHGECAKSLRITINGQRESINTGVSVGPDLWDSAKGKVKGKSEYVNSQNNLLSTISSKVTRIYTEIINSGMPVTSAIIKSRFNGNADTTTSLLYVVKLLNVYVHQKFGAEVVKAKYVKYETLRKKPEACIAKEYNRNDLFLKKLNRWILMNFKLFLQLKRR